MDGAKELKEALVKYAVQERREIKLVRNTTAEVRAKCVNPNCQWMIFGLKDTSAKGFLIKTYIPEHSCAISFKNRRVTTKWIARNYLYKYKSIASMRLTDLKNLIKEDLKLEMSLTKVKRARQHVLDKLQGDIKKEFALLWDYVGEIERSNEGSTTRLKVARPLEGSLPVFEGLYISINCLKEGI